MNFKPSEFFIGLVDFISILLPGAVLTMVFLVFEYNHPAQPGHALFEFALRDDFQVIFWVTFIFTSFGLGYFLSSAASGLDYFYDVIRRQIYPYGEDLSDKFRRKNAIERQHYLDIYEGSLQEPGAIIDERLTEEEKMFHGYKIVYARNVARKLLALLFKLKLEVRVDYSYEETRKLLNAQPASVAKANNAFKWAITVLEAYFPTINELSTRMMAASKFFRSMVIVSLIFLVLQATHQIATNFWGINLTILLLSFREYFVQRQKSVSKAYQSIVTLTHFDIETLSLPGRVYKKPDDD